MPPAFGTSSWDFPYGSSWNRVRHGLPSIVTAAPPPLCLAPRVLRTFSSCLGWREAARGAFTGFESACGAQPSLKSLFRQPRDAWPGRRTTAGHRSHLRSPPIGCRKAAATGAHSAAPATEWRPITCLTLRDWDLHCDRRAIHPNARCTPADRTAVYSSQQVASTKL
jgi:hypothetical protein